MNEELLADSALLVRSGAFLVSVNIKLASGLQTVKTPVDGTCNCPMLSQPKSAVHKQLFTKVKAASHRELATLYQPLKGRQITRTKACRQSVSLNCATNVTSQLMLVITGRNRII
jgi:hypothetical protein